LQDALQLAKDLLDSYEISASEDVLKYLLQQKIEWLIPFHIQLAIKEIRDLYRLETKQVDKSFIDKAFNELDFKRKHLFRTLSRPFESSFQSQ